ncbi:MAG: energy-coupling factor ABC transporter permease, partial [Gammaproteobacteria bacterium]
MSASLVGPVTQLCGALLLLLAVTTAVRRAPWRWLVRSGSLNRYAAASACVLALWQLRATLDGGPALHLLGATLLTLAFGWQLALVALNLVLLACVLGGDGDWRTLGINGSINALVPVAVSYGWARVSEQRLPRHLFVFIFSAGFFGAMLAVAATALSAGTLLYLAGLMESRALFGN